VNLGKYSRDLTILIRVEDLTDKLLIVAACGRTWLMERSALIYNH
jgi:hypothetical protein